MNASTNTFALEAEQHSRLQRDIESWYIEVSDDQDAMDIDYPCDPMDIDYEPMEVDEPSAFSSESAPEWEFSWLAESQKLHEAAELDRRSWEAWEAYRKQSFLAAQLRHVFGNNILETIIKDGVRTDEQLFVLNLAAPWRSRIGPRQPKNILPETPLPGDQGQINRRQQDSK
ncbi:hypothetical protein N658DRAFT_506820 [Parathielavia hyrcaniae]|uniref:Uncharacterized protein n=1 Tax=Parathielavia hyrcaniae TaxID=113614 RepID=A0AAN6Q2J7_9PEZI|nr:hypothetical protein N658DRAFT_506820 [Parathielavia hyrcaniae]